MIIEQQDVFENRIQCLTKLGLTYTQARIYTLLESFDKSQAKTLTYLSKLPRQDVYKTLDELYELGFIEKELTKPVTFRAIPAKKCLSILIQNRKNKIIEIEEIAKKAFTSVDKKNVLTETRTLKNSILSLKKESILLETSKMINNAKESIWVLSASQKLFPWLLTDKKLLRKALDRKVKIQLITNQDDIDLTRKALLKLNNNSYFEIRYLPFSPETSFGIYDKKTMIFELEATNGFLDAETIITDNPSAVNVATNCFQFLHNQSKK